MKLSQEFESGGVGMVTHVGMNNKRLILYFKTGEQQTKILIESDDTMKVMELVTQLKNRVDEDKFRDDPYYSEFAYA